MTIAITLEAAIDQQIAANETAIAANHVTFAEIGYTAPPTPEAFGAYIKSERINWAKVVKASGMKVD